MIIFNTTYHIDEDIHDECLLFFTNNYIKKAEESKLIKEFRMALIHSAQDTGGYNYSVQFLFDNIDDLESWMKTAKQDLDDFIVSKYEQKVCGFCTIMEEIDLNK